MTVPLLKQELRFRKAKLSGEKHQLIERLESYDRNDNFGHQLVQAEQFNMNVPEQSGYKDINSETQDNTKRLTRIQAANREDAKKSWQLMDPSKDKGVDFSCFVDDLSIPTHRSRTDIGI
ncbi:hypothetical protein LSH36_605g03009 [Paralvinella palmiformis]|uniref:SAP domain-containing protein n=1 Tax=Paralvinella palmiformis TaxID=53620 RepID=A0AAD9J5G8_9ANNE|nr:hypothetical protein LSH36_605g03009 [Paralvinella palmiformis]